MIDLTAKRYKVIADYPGSFLEVGKVMSGESFGKIFDRMQFDKYPHLFKELAWYEERDKKDFPEYVKRIEYEDVRKVKSYSYPMIEFEGTYIEWRVDKVLPATKTEYEEYLLTNDRPLP